ncbi:hypothetical protein CALCODRAFT_505019 [Calocera cornea HHB12733]|uniref:Uncharacterized protein n=1 Tax=Calocera cornea HHB12733 TaxID=1353952 RepID=A0A165C2B8_9BASI|nr:hypothetical protein CALCODRAFT_505019 [Calocera cornea HHB12733]
MTSDPDSGWTGPPSTQPSRRTALPPLQTPYTPALLSVSSATEVPPSPLEGFWTPTHSQQPAASVLIKSEPLTPTLPETAHTFSEPDTFPHNTREYFEVPELDQPAARVPRPTTPQATVASVKVHQPPAQHARAAAADPHGIHPTHSSPPSPPNRGKVGLTTQNKDPEMHDALAEANALIRRLGGGDGQDREKLDGRLPAASSHTPWTRSSHKDSAYEHGA